MAPNFDARLSQAEGNSDELQRLGVMIPITLTTIVVTSATSTEPQWDESLESNYSKYRSSPITFEEYFAKPETQRRFFANLIQFQLVLNLTAAVTSVICTVLTDQVWFWKGNDTLLNSLLLHTGILSLVMLFLPFFSYQLRKWDKRNDDTKILKVLLRAYQSSLCTFWFSFVSGKIWKSDDYLDTLQISTLPIFFLPFYFYTLNFIINLVTFSILRYTSINIQCRTVVVMSFVISCFGLMIALPLVQNLVVGRGFVVLTTAQILTASAFSCMEESLSFCFLEPFGREDGKSQDIV